MRGSPHVDEHWLPDEFPDLRVGAGCWRQPSASLRHPTPQYSEPPLPCEGGFVYETDPRNLRTPTGRSKPVNLPGSSPVNPRQMGGKLYVR